MPANDYHQYEKDFKSLRLENLQSGPQIQGQPLQHLLEAEKC
jgi:hypothetical protein